MQQLELRRRFHPQSRRLASHLSHPYVSSHLSPHLLAHNRNHSLRHTQYCNCSDDSLPNGWCLPPQSYDFIDYRSYYRNFEDDSQSNTAILGNRSHSWTNWLNWSRNHVPVSANEMLNHNSNRNANRGLLNLILRRNNNNQRVRESNGLNANTIQWRSLNTHNFLPPHVFIPRIGSGGLSTLPMHFSRYRDNNTHNLRGNLLSAMNSSHRRTRSNDGIFHHLNIGLSHNSANDYISCPPRATNVSSNVFALWGPPPPYTCSQPQSLNRINAICNNLNRSSQAQHRRESSIHSSDANQGSKMSTPISERRIRCNAFSSQGIRLTIEGNDNSLAPKSKGSCIVEIHVPYNEEQHNNGVHEIEELRNGQKKMNPSFNTLPNIKRNEHIIQINNFKSLSNIPLTFPNKLNSTQYESHASIINSDYELNKPKLEAIRNVFCSQISAPKSSLSSSTPNTTSDTTTEITSESLSENTENSTSAVSFPVDPPTDYKSTLIIHTPNTQSSPITDQSSAFAQRQVINGKKVKDFQLNNAQSMPNLSCILPTSASKSNTSTRSQPHFWDIHRIPSSGNTSTSQDFADFEFEFDEEPLKFAADLPHDHLETNSASNSISVNKSNSNTSSVTPEFIQPPTPFNTQNYFSTTSNATISPLSDPKADIIINVKGIQV